MTNVRHTVIAGTLLLSAIAFSSTTFSFYRITDDSPDNAGIGEAQFSVEVIEAGENEVDFVFRNGGPAASSICDIYFDNGPLGTGALQSINSIDNSSDGVAFSQGATPHNLPGGHSYGFQTTPGLSLDSDSPVQPNGINPDEYLGVSVLASSYGDVINQMNHGSLRIGLHVQGFADGSSESYLNGISIIPSPASILLAAAGLGLVKAFRFRK